MSKPLEPPQELEERRYKVLTSTEFAAKICVALGLDPVKITSLVLTMHAQELPLVDVTYVAGLGLPLLDVPLPQATLEEIADE